MTDPIFKNEKLGFLLRSVESHLKTIASKELQRRAAKGIIEKLMDIVQGKKREYWVMEERFIALEKWLTADGIYLISNSLSMGDLQLVVNELEKLKGFNKARWMNSDDSKSSQLRRLLKKNIRLAHDFLNKASAELNLEYTPLGFVESEESHKTSQSYAQLDPSRNEYLKMLGYQEEMLSNFYDNSYTLMDILESEIKNFEEHLNPRDEMLIVNLLYFLKLKSIDTDKYFKILKKASNKENLSTQKV